MCDASYPVALQGEPERIHQLAEALRNPTWSLYLGRKCCPPSLPIFSDKVLPCASHDALLDALMSVPVFPRHNKEAIPDSVVCFLDWIPQHPGDTAPADAQIWYDVPVSLDPPAHNPRFVLQRMPRVGENGELTVSHAHERTGAAPPRRPQADYRNSEYRAMRAQRLDKDRHLCVFCKSFGTTVQHITYQHAGGEEQIEELRTLCRLCHDAVTMIEYGHNMGMERINPEDPAWRDDIIETRQQIIAQRSLETRRRKLNRMPEEIE